MVRNRCSIFCQLTSVEHQATCSSLVFRCNNEKTHSRSGLRIQLAEFIQRGPEPMHLRRNWR